MKRIDDHYNETLYDPWYYLGPKRRRLLEQGWAGMFRTYLFDELPLTEIKERFHDSMGRPSKELYAMLDVRDESDESMYVCERTLREYRSLAVESKIDEILFRSLTDKLLKTFRIPTGKQRLDSTHLLSNMKRLSRLNLFVRTIEKFLKELRRSHPRILQSQVDGALAARAVKARILAVFQQKIRWSAVQFNCGSEIHRPARRTGVIPQDRTTLHLLLAA